MTCITLFMHYAAWASPPCFKIILSRLQVGIILQLDSLDIISQVVLRQAMFFQGRLDRAAQGIDQKSEGAGIQTGWLISQEIFFVPEAR